MGKPERKLVLGVHTYELAGIVSTVSLGTILHFAFEVSGGPPVGAVLSCARASSS